LDRDSGQDLVFLTNHLELSALPVAQQYRLRWHVELFFKWNQTTLAYQGVLQQLL